MDDMPLCCFVVVVFKFTQDVHFSVKMFAYILARFSKYVFYNVFENARYKQHNLWKR